MGLQHLKTCLPQGILVASKTVIRVEEQPVIDEPSGVLADVRLGLGQVVEDQVAARRQHPVGLPKRLFLVVDVIDGGLAPHMAECAILEGQVGGRGLLEFQAALHIRRLGSQGIDGVVDADAAQVNAGHVAAGLPC